MAPMRRRRAELSGLDMGETSEMFQEMQFIEDIERDTSLITLDQDEAVVDLGASTDSSDIEDVKHFDQ